MMQKLYDIKITILFTFILRLMSGIFNFTAYILPYLSKSSENLPGNLA